MKKVELCKLVGAKIREIRKSRKMTLESLAFEADMAYTQLSRIERGKINTSIHQLYKICDVLHVDVFSTFLDYDAGEGQLKSVSR